MPSKLNTRSFTNEFSLDEERNKRKLETTLSISKRLARKLTQKIRLKKPGRKQLFRYLTEERASEKPKPRNCISFYIKSSGCNRVVSCEDIDLDRIKKLSISDDCLPLKASDKKNSRKTKNLDQCVHEISLPDDIIEMILLRSNFKIIAVARVVCKKWNEMVTSSQFLHLRQKLNYSSPWLFLFGLSRKGENYGEVFALDIVHDSWVTISNGALKDKFLYSVTNIGSDIYIVGGCSALTTHKEVIIFSPLTNSWHEISPMNVARSEPIVGVFELDSSFNIFQNRKTNQSRLNARSFRSSEVYGDPHKLSLRRESSSLLDLKTKASNTSNKKFALIVVGGNGFRNERLGSGEIYDPCTDKWIDIPCIPEELGSSISSGAVHSNWFYIYSIASNKLASYNVESGNWALIQTQQPPCIRNFKPRLICCEGRMLMCCVCWSDRTEQAARMVWEFDREMNSWRVVSRHPDAPMDKNAMYCVAGDRIYGLEMFKVFGQGLDFLTVGRVCDGGLEWSRVSRKRVGREGCVDSGSVKSVVVVSL